MEKFEEQIKNLREELKSMLTKDSPKDQVDKVASIDSKIDELVETHGKFVNDYNDLKTDYIGMVKKSNATINKGNPYANDKGEDLNVNDNFEEIFSNFHKEYAKKEN